MATADLRSSHGNEAEDVESSLSCCLETCIDSLEAAAAEEARRREAAEAAAVLAVAMVTEARETQRRLKRIEANLSWLMEQKRHLTASGAALQCQLDACSQLVSQIRLAVHTSNSSQPQPLQQQRRQPDQVMKPHGESESAHHHHQQQRVLASQRRPRPQSHETAAGARRQLSRSLHQLMAVEPDGRATCLWRRDLPAATAAAAAPAAGGDERPRMRYVVHFNSGGGLSAAAAARQFRLAPHPQSPAAAAASAAAAGGALGRRGSVVSCYGSVKKSLI